MVEAVDRRIRAIPNVPTISTYDAELRDPAHHAAPVMFSVVWIASRISVTSRIVAWFVGSKFQPNQLWVRPRRS